MENGTNKCFKRIKMNSEYVPNIAVLLAAYNGRKWIEEQINSILQQQNVNVSLFISVDLSQDGTFEWCQQLASNHTNIKVLSYGERFGGAAPNFYRLIRDVELDSYDAISWADQDDIWHLDKLAIAFKKLSSGECDVYSSNVIAFWEDGRKILIEKSQPQRKLDHFFEAAGPGCTYVFKNEAMKDLKKLILEAGNKVNKITQHDWLAYALCREKGYRWFIDPKPSMLYRQHANNQVGTNNNLLAYKKRFKMIRENWLREQVNLVASLVAPEKLPNLNNRLYLIRNFKELRRRSRDRFVLCLIFILNIY